MGFTKYPPAAIDSGGYFPHKLAAMADILSEIEAFNHKNELSDSQFGVLALNDKNLIPQLRGDGGKRPRRLWPETEQAVRDFMARYEKPASERAA